MVKKRVTAPELAAIKARGEKVTVLTAYDYGLAKLVDEAGIDVVLVGDSLGMVVLGYETTLQVTMEDMIRHTAAVARGTKHALVLADMPFLSYQASADDAVRNAGRLVQEGFAQAVKLEGGEQVADTIKRIIAAGIPVVGHLGLTPQSVNRFGGYKMQGKDEENAARIRKDALILQDAGASAIVLESMPASLAGEISKSLVIPTIGIGAGPDCDGQVLVSYDMLGIYGDFVPSFVKQYANVGKVALDAISAYAQDVREGRYPERK